MESTRPIRALIRGLDALTVLNLRNGATVSEIAQDLFLSVKMVSAYRARILEKMGMKTNANITYYAIKHGLIQ